MKYITVLFFLFIAIATHAQNSSVTGQVTDAMTNESLEYSSVAIYNVEDSSLVTGVITNPLGFFKIEKLKPCIYQRGKRKCRRI